MKLSPKAIEKVARETLGLVLLKSKRRTKRNKLSYEDIRVFRSCLGVSFNVLSNIWNRLDPKQTISNRAQPKHLLWAFVFMKVYGTEQQHCRIVRCNDRKNFRKWSWKFVNAIFNLHDEVIVWDNRFKGWTGDTAAMVTIDGTDCRIQEPNPFCPIWFSHKFDGPGVRYEIGICIKTGDIVWFAGPFPAGVSDKEIFDSNLSGMLHEFELVEADGGYMGRLQIATPGMAATRKDRKQKSQARGRHEATNNLAKVFNILKATWRHSLSDHKKVMGAILVTTQIAFDVGGHLFEVEFDVNYD